MKISFHFAQCIIASSRNTSQKISYIDGKNLEKIKMLNGREIKYIGLIVWTTLKNLQEEFIDI